MDESKKFEGGMKYYIGGKTNAISMNFIENLKAYFERNYGVFIDQIE